MSRFHRFYGGLSKVSVLCAVMAVGSVFAQDYGSMGISSVVAAADQMLQSGDFENAIPPLQEVIRRTANLTDPAGKETLQMCRFQLARSFYQTDDVFSGIPILEDYMNNEPRSRERMVLRMLAQGYYDMGEWAKIEPVARRLLAIPKLEADYRINGNLMLGQSLFRLKRWAESVKPLSYVVANSPDKRIKSACEIMVVRALLESENWPELYVWIPRLYRTDSKYDITLTLTLMKAGKARFEMAEGEREEGDSANEEQYKDDYRRAMSLYRMVLPRDELVRFTVNRISEMTEELDADVKIGIKKIDEDRRRKEIELIADSIKTVDGLPPLDEELPPYEQEVTYRIGQCYFQLKRYWEGYVLFDKLYRDDSTGEVGEAAMVKSVQILYEVGEIARAEERIIRYLDEHIDGKFASTLLTMIMRDNYTKDNYKKVIDLMKYVKALPTPVLDPEEEEADIAQKDYQDEMEAQSGLYYVGAFAYFQAKEYNMAEELFTGIIDKYAGTPFFDEARYYRGMALILQAQFARALADFQLYQAEYPNGNNYPASVYRLGYCYFGLGGNEADPEKGAELIKQAEETFTRFINTYPTDMLVSEAHAMRGDIEAAKDSADNPDTPDIDESDPHTLDRALADYRKAIDKATTSLQASYPAFQAAKVYELEYKWQDIINLMNYYLSRWENMADIAEAVFWIGQSQIELGQIPEALEAYTDSIKRFGNDVEQQGVDKIILELVKIANERLYAEDRESLNNTIESEMASAGTGQEVYKLRLQMLQALLQGSEAAEALGIELLAKGQDLSVATPVTLGMMCDAATAAEDKENMGALADYFIENYEGSDQLWHAYRARTYKQLADGDKDAVLETIDVAQGLFGADEFMGWAQIIKANILFEAGEYDEAEAAYNLIMGVAEWRGPLFAESMYGMGACRLAKGEYAVAHTYFQRAYLLFKGYDKGKWAAKGYLGAAECLVKLDRKEDAIKTLNAMLDDSYTAEHPLAATARKELKELGVQL